MQQTKRLVPFILTMVLMVCLSVTFISEAAGAKLTDINGHWAQESVIEMNANGVIAGYPGGVFRPEKNVSKLEAVTLLVRVLGLEEQAKALETANLDYKMPPTLTWGKGYLVMGVQRGMLNKDYLYQLQPDAPASRVEVAVLVYHALKLSPGGSSLSFTDADQIPAEYRECVSAVVKNNIIQGFPGNIFKPNEEITRAQLAVILSRLVENKFADPYPTRRISGSISSINPTDHILKIQMGDYGFINKIYTKDCSVFIDGKTTTPANLSVGDEVRMIVNENGHVVFIKVVQAKAAEKYSGQITNMFQISAETWLALTALDGTKITRPLQGVSASSLSIGKYVAIELVDNKIVKVSLLETSMVKGTVTSVSTSKITVRDNDGKTKEIQVPENVIVQLNGSTVPYDSVKKYDRVEVTVYDNKAASINTLGSGELEGEITDLDVEDYVITIRDNDGDREDYDVKEDVEVERDGDEIDFDDLEEGETIRFELDSRDRIMYIEVLDSGGLEGEITDLDATGTFWITILNDEDDEEEYEVDSDVEVERDGDDIDFDELDEGERVRLELDSRDRVVSIEVISSGDLEGKITDLDTSGTYGITIRKDNGDEEEYEVVSDVAVERDGHDIDFDELDEGERVKLELSSRDRVVTIEVIDSSDLEGEIRDLDIRGTYGITIRSNDGDTVEYVVDDDVEVERDGDDIDFDELDEGEWVVLELNNRDRVIYIEVISAKTGTVNELVTGRNSMIRIEQSNRRKVQYDISTNTSIIRDGKSIDLEDVVIGSEVELRVSDGTVDRIKVVNDQDITLEGEVTYVSTSRNMIRIVQSSDNGFTYYLSDGAILKDEDGYTIDLEDVEEDWLVILELQDGEIYKLTRKY